MRMGSCNYVPSCQTPKATASRGLEQSMLIHYGQALDTLDQGPELAREAGGADKCQNPICPR
jgi:hypothetical protein